MKLLAVFPLALLSLTFVTPFEGKGAAAPADFNDDGFVDGADLSRWQAAFSLANPPALELADADGDGDTDGQDYLAWQRQYSDVVEDDIVLAPEPATISLIIPFAAYLICLSGRTNRAMRVDTAHGLPSPSKHFRLGIQCLGK